MHDTALHCGEGEYDTETNCRTLQEPNRIVVQHPMTSPASFVQLALSCVLDIFQEDENDTKKKCIPWHVYVDSLQSAQRQNSTSEIGLILPGRL